LSVPTYAPHAEVAVDFVHHASLQVSDDNRHVVQERVLKKVLCQRELRWEKILTIRSTMFKILISGYLSVGSGLRI
jgi:hypothetical protein